SHGSLACSEGAGVGPPGDGGPSRAAAPARLGGFDNEPTVQPAGPPPPGVAVSKSARGRGPTGVTMADLEDYREAIFNDRLRKDPEKLGPPGVGLELVPTRGRRLASSCHRAPVETRDLCSALVGISNVVQARR